MKLKTFLILFFVLILSSLTSSQLTEIGDKEKPKPIEIFEPVISSRTATTDTYYMGGNEFKTTYYAGAVNAKLNNNTYIPFEDYVNVSNENGKVKFENIYGEICYLEPEYELTNLFSTAKTEVNIVKNRGSYYFTTDAKDDVNSMSYKINCLSSIKETKEKITNDDIKFIDNQLYILNDVKINFRMALDVQNITTVYNETTSKLDFAIEDGKTGDLKMIDPTITYDFNNHTGQSAYKCEGYYYSFGIAENPVDLPPDCTIISSYSSWHDITTETTIDEIDESREDIYVAVARTNNFFYTNFTIPSELEVTKYEWFLTSNVGTSTNADVRYLVYNYTSSLWVLIKTVNQGSTDSTENITLTEGDYNLTDFTDENGKINFIALSLRGGEPYHFYINYVELEVTYESDSKLNFTSPNTTNPSTVSEAQKLAINFSFYNGETPITSGVTLNNFSVGGQTATIDQKCSGTLVCSGYSTEAECNNCSQCNWTTIVEITVVSNTSANSLAKTVTIDKPSDVQDDDVLFVYLFHDNNDAGDEFATLSGWTQIFSLTDDPSGRGGTTWLGYKVITDASGEPADYTFTHTDSVDEETGAIMVNLRGVDTDDPLANSTGYTYLFQANTGDFLTPSITTDSDNALVLTMGSMSHTMTYANAPSGTNKIVYMDDDYDNLMMASYTQESAGATGDKQWDTDGTQEARGEQVAFKLGTASSCSAIDSGDCSSCSLDECNTNCSTGGCSSENDISYVGDYWQFNATMPYGLSGSQDIFLNISYGESNYNQTEPDAITYTGGAADPCDYISGDYIINLEDNCTKTGVNIDVTGDFKVYGYYGYFLLDQYTNLTVAGNMAFNFTDSNIVLRDGSKLS